MYLRLAFSVAAHLEPEILLVDEVLAVGDAAFQKKCLGKMGEIHRTGRTVLFVSHNMHAISTLCTSGLLFDSGRIIVAGNVASCIRAYEKTTYISQGAVIDTSELTRANGCGDRLRILKVSIQTNDGSPRVPFSSPLIIDMEFVCTKAISEVVLGLGVNAFDGTRILTCHSDDVIKPFNTLAGLRYKARFSLHQNQLNTGLYNLDVIARSGSLSLDYLTGFMQFEVFGFSQRDDTPIEDRRGFMRPQSFWNVSEIEQRR
jgi:lipopolysaccharide transport system ATP-binding protein